MARTGGTTGNRAARTGLALAIALAVSLLLAVVSSPGRVLAQDGRADDADRRAGSDAPTFEAPQNLPRYAPDRVVVGLEKGAGESALEAPKDETGARESREINNGRVEVLILPESSGTTASEAVEVFGDAPGIAYAERDAILVLTDVPPTPPNDTFFDRQWALDNKGTLFTGDVPDSDTDAIEAWTVGKGAGATVAIVDAGIETSHPDLKDNLWTNPDEVAGNGVDDDNNGKVDDVHGWDFYYNDASLVDANESSHGMHVAGTVAAEANNGIGVAGIAPEAKVASLKFVDSSGSAFASLAAEAIDYAVAEGMPISNNSYGCYQAVGCYSTTLENAVKRANLKGHLFVAGAGNGNEDGIGDDNDVTPFYPASLNVDNVVSVASTTSSDSLSDFSNYGAKSVDLGAPGRGIYSTVLGEKYTYKSGTSMATPHVAAVAAILEGLNPGSGAPALKSKLMGSVDPLPSLAGKTVSGGRLNAANAVGYEEPPVDATPPTVSLTAPADGAADGAVVAGGVALSAEAADDRGVSRVDFYVGTQKVGSDDTAGGSGGSEYSLEWDSTTVSDGGKAVTATAFDASNNQKTSAARGIVVNNSFPETGVSGGPSEGSSTRSTAATFDLASTDGDTFRCQLDGGAVEPCSSPKAYTDLGEGGHTFSAWAVGSAGEATDTDPTPATRRWSVDGVAPSGTVVISGGAAATRSLKVKLTLEASDPAPASGVARMRLSNDGKSWSAWGAYGATKNWSLKKGKAGTRTVFAQFSDGAGNISATAKDTIKYKP